MLIPVGLLRICAMCAAVSASAQEAVLEAFVRDESGQPSPCTVALTDSNGKLVTETESFKAGFRCDGQFRKNLPPGRTTIRITHGFETKFVERELELQVGKTNQEVFTLGRIVDLRKRGWYAGDSHVHMLHGERTVPVSFDFIATTARAEDLQYVSVAQAWDIPEVSPEALENQLRPRSRPDCILTWNLEAPKNYYKGDAGRCLGHCWNVGMKGRTPEGSNVISVLQAASAWDYESEKPTYANFESHQLIHQQGGAVFYTHPARWWWGTWGGQGGYPKQDRMRVSNMAVELPLDAVVGPTFDGVDVITGPGEAEANEKAFALWAMLLNQGYRLSATGSSDACFDRPGGAAPGIPRTYTFLPGGFSIEKVTQATSAGHTFVTTGPLLIATVDGQPPGSVFGTGTNDHTLAIEAWASGAGSTGLDRAQILRNGQLFKQCVFSDHPESIRTNISFRTEARCWYSVRLWGAGAKNQQAITSAFYFGEGNAPASVRALVRARIVDGETGRPLSGAVTEVQFCGILGRDITSHALPTGEGLLNVPGTVRLRGEAPGYSRQVLSPVLDNPRLMKVITTLSDADLLDWRTYEKMREELSNVELEFRLQRRAQ